MKMGDPVGSYAPNYQGYGPSLNAQYQGPPQPLYPPSAALEPRASLDLATWTQYQASVPPQYAQPPHLPATAPQSYSGQAASSVINYQPPPQYFAPPPPPPPLGYWPGTNIQPSQQFVPSVLTVQPPIRGNYGERQYPQSAYPTNPPNGQLGFYELEYRNFAPPSSTYPPMGSSYGHSLYHATPHGQNSSSSAPLNPAPAEAPSPLTIEPSLKAVLRTTVPILSYLRDVKNGSSSCKKLLLALLSTRGLLDTFVDTLQHIEDPRDWAATVNLLCQKDSPITALSSTLDKLYADLSRNTSGLSFKKCTKWFPWPIPSTETENMLESINSQSVLLLIALDNDHVLLASEISKKNSAFRGARDNALAPQGQYASRPGLEPVDITSMLSGMHITSHPTPITSSQPVSVPLREDGIEWVVQAVLRPDLETGQIAEMIRPDHPCFNESREFARIWNIPDQAVDNHVKLACGYTKFPVILLLNPSPGHRRLSFDYMVRACPTLSWVQGVLQELELRLDDVIILDICTLLDKDFLDRMPKSVRSQAIDQAYEVTHRMLEMIKPKIIVSCQCSTSYEEWGGGSHVIARELCSTVTGANNGNFVSTYILGPTPVYVVQGHHPRYFLGRTGPEVHNEEILRGILHRVYRPCGRELKRMQSSSFGWR